MRGDRDLGGIFFPTVPGLECIVVVSIKLDGLAVNAV